jgi:gluconolactonase
MRIAWLMILLGACGGGGGGGGGDDDDDDDDDVVAPDAARATDGAAPIDPLDGIGTVSAVMGGYQFLEGPQWLEGDGLLVFSDVQGNTIYQLLPPSDISPFRAPSGNANGNAVAPDGDLLTCEHGNRRVSRTTGSEVATVASSYQGASLNSPNDVIVRDDGTVYFTDPPYGITDDQRELDFIGTFRVPAGGGPPIAEVMGPLTARPNGIGLSPDQSTLYVDDTDLGVVHAYDVATDGSLSGERTLSADTPGADGLAIDADGNLFVATAAGVRVIAPDGATWGTIEVPEQPSNCAFGNDDHHTLFITARTGLYAVHLARAGLPDR